MLFATILQVPWVLYYGTIVAGHRGSAFFVSPGYPHIQHVASKCASTEEEHNSPTCFGPRRWLSARVMLFSGSRSKFTSAKGGARDPPSPPRANRNALKSLPLHACLGCLIVEIATTLIRAGRSIASCVFIEISPHAIYRRKKKSAFGRRVRRIALA